MENKINFLSIAISDAQDLIKFIDTKTAIIITILGGYVVAFFATIDKIVEYSFGYSNWFWFFITAFFFLVILCIIITTRIIKPTNNPVANINFGNSINPVLKFFLTPNDYTNGSLESFKNSEQFKLTENFETFKQVLNTSGDNEIIDSLTLELFKVSFIRNIKNDRFNTLLWLLLITTVLFIISYLLYSIETHDTIERIEQLKQHCCGS